MVKSAAVREAVEPLYEELRAAGVDVLLDDRDLRPGAKFADAELLGIPHRVVLGERGLAEGQVEYRHRRDAASEHLPLDDAAARIAALVREGIARHAP
jgi:prolyl-tRNA synthetase